MTKSKRLILGSLMSMAMGLFGHNALAQEAANTTALSNPKVLVAYYSWSGNTKEVANAIHKQVGGDLFEIQTVEAYPSEYSETTAQAKKEINEGFRPKLKGSVDNMAQYDVVFIGSPNWWGTIAPAVSSFIEAYDLNGKTVIPFITHGGGGEQNTIRDMTAQCKGCKVKSDGWVGYGSRTLGVSGWLEDMGFPEK